MLEAAELEDVARSCREALVRELEEDGSLRTPEWRAVVAAVPRHVFVPDFYTDAPGPDGVTRYTPVNPRRDAREWLRSAYRNQTWVTQLDLGATSSDAEAVSGTPTSSSTLPGIVVRMLEDLEVGPGDHVLEVGTGTGYSTALLCARLGSDKVSSVEYDRVLSEQAAERLAGLGFSPRLVVGDGASGSADFGPYDGIIAGYSPSRVPGAWLDQAAENAVILASLVGSLDAYGYIRLRMVSRREAVGRFIDAPVSFMRSRKTERPVVGPLMRTAYNARQGMVGTPSRLDGAALAAPGLRWALQLALPGVVRLGLNVDGVVGTWFLHPDGSWAALESGPHQETRAYPDDPHGLWKRIENIAAAWVADGRPAMGRYGLTVTSDTNTVWLDEPGNVVALL
jgi:protein-L-isoaspartate O-methyltransferase